MSPVPQVSCVFVCHDGAGRLLLAQRSAGARDEPGTWDCGAGAVEFGEEFEQALAREVREEYGTDPLTVERLGVRTVIRPDPPSHWVAVVFAVRIDPDAATIGEPHKFAELGWFAPDALPAPLHSQLPATLALLRRDRLRLELFVAELERTVAFYTDVLGFAVERWDPGYVSLRRGDVVLGIGPATKLPPGRTGRGGGIEIVLEVGAGELPELERRCRAAGALAEALTDREWGLRDFRFTDPDGFYVRVTHR